MREDVFSTIQPVEKKALSFRIIEQIKGKIMRGELKANQQLPTEKELTEIFQVGRSTVREALTALVSMGLISREKEGLFVVENAINAFKNQVNPLQLSKVVTFSEVFELRKLLESSLVPLVVLRATDEDIEDIENCLQDHEDLGLNHISLDVETLEKFFSLDICFHTLFARASHNSVAHDLFNNIKDMLFYTHEMYSLFWDIEDEEIRNTLCNAVKEHRALLNALKDRDALLMEDLINQHLDNVFKTLKSSIDSK
ncbi:MAG: FadR/GntR family transcriptional regulator [Bacillota bacterium]|nr:FadR/GntR family transcriptional regulator [Bacillota bacterium]